MSVQMSRGLFGARVLQPDVTMDKLSAMSWRREDPPINGESGDDYVILWAAKTSLRRALCGGDRGWLRRDARVAEWISCKPAGPPPPRLPSDIINAIVWKL